MVIVWGSKIMGKVDVVPGLFHVATKFGHIYYIPLIPTATFVVLSQDSTNFRGVPIGLSAKSILVAWLRTGLFLAAMIATCVTAVFAGDKHGPGLAGPLVAAVLLWALFALTWHKFVTRASFSRARSLGERIGMTPEGMEAIRKIYGMPPSRGFEVKRVAPGTAPTSAISMAQARPAQAAPRRAAVVADGGAIPLEPMSPPTPAAKPIRKPPPPPIGIS
jgi:hypothetical protein